MPRMAPVNAFPFCCFVTLARVMSRPLDRSQDVSYGCETLQVKIQQRICTLIPLIYLVESMSMLTVRRSAIETFEKLMLFISITYQ